MAGDRSDGGRGDEQDLPFSWGLTPSTEPDPLVAQPAAAEGDEADSGVEESAGGEESPGKESPGAEESAGTGDVTAVEGATPDSAPASVAEPEAGGPPTDAAPPAPDADAEPAAVTDALAVLLPDDFFVVDPTAPQPIVDPASAAGTRAPDAPAAHADPTVLLEASYFLDGTGATPPVSALTLPPADSLPPLLASSTHAVTGAMAGERVRESAGDAGTATAEQSRDGRSRAAGSRTRAGRERGRPAASDLPPALIWIAAGLLAILVLVGLFFLGTRLPSIFAGAPAPTPAPTRSATPAPSPTQTPTPTPTPTPAATGPQAAGVHAWDTLRGGECVQPYTSPWAEKFTVVDCATPHAAQLVRTGVFATDAAAAYPGEAALAGRMNLLCTAPGVIDLGAAGGVADLQFQASYPVTAEQWTSGQRSYYCFVSQASGAPLSVSVAGPGAAPAG